MGERGPLPQSRAARVLSMNASHRPLPPKGDDATAAEDDPLPKDPPKMLGQYGRAEWKRIQPILERRGHWRARFLQAVQIYCIVVNNLTSAQVEIDRDGTIIEEPIILPTGQVLNDFDTGKPMMRKKPHPALKMQKDALGRLDVALKALGLTPASEPRVPRADAGRKRKQQGAYERRQK